MPGFRIQELIPSWKLLDGEIRLGPRGGDTSVVALLIVSSPAAVPDKAVPLQWSNWILASHTELGIKGVDFEGLDF